MNDTKFSRLDPGAVDPWKKTEPSLPAKKQKSVRLTIDLDSGCRGTSGYIFSYEDLVKKANSKNGGCLPDLMSHDSQEELKRVASSYEDKYGRDTGNKRRYQSYADLGAGYDLDDSFIDNDDAKEEGIPDEMDTKKGGFYVNSGILELKNRK